MDFTLEAIIREGLPAPEPDLARQLAHADAWATSPVPRERLLAVNELAASFFQTAFPGSWAQPYLAERLHTDLTGDPGWRPGLAPNTWNALVTHLRRHDVTDTELLTAGLATTTRDGRLIDRFRNRLVFPITSPDGVLGFVGRRHPHLGDHDHAGPKYLNTPETPLFHKGDQLFARAGGLDDGAVPVVVEGPLDAIAVTLASAGRYTGVAPLGTSLTDTQAAQLRETGRTPIIATDADPAGQTAAQRDYWNLTPHKIDPRHAALPEGSDPADLVATSQTEALIQALDDAGPLADTLRHQLLHDQPDAEAVLDALRVIAAQPPHQWETGLQHVADQLHLPADALAPTLQDLIRAWNDNPAVVAERALPARSRERHRLRSEGEHVFSHRDASVFEAVNAVRSPEPPRSLGVAASYGDGRGIDR